MKKQTGDDAGLKGLPQQCLARIVSHTSPLDACRLALVSPTLRSAADSDAVWEKFLLLSDYKSMISQANVSWASSSFISKKELFYRLCHYPVLIEHAKKSFWLDKWSGKKCFMIAARELVVIKSDVPDNWTWTNLPESRFKEAAELLPASRLDIQAKIDTAMLSPATKYAAYLVFKWRTNSCGGLNRHPTQVSIGVSDHKRTISRVYLVADIEPQPDFRIRRCSAYVDLSHLEELQRPWKRRDGWLEIELGEYFNDKGDDGELEMSVVDLTTTKTGLIVQGIEIRPK